ncbi:PLP-dependent transferase [Penicillium angulare]|uniref:PLP-dependent transferase n=1 Tax=Penicillium angulare TaxID=116970 RepID=A0A9W9JZS0_9EURO|nr:PLP-dependent transferase [Penicillium angulare]
MASLTVTDIRRLRLDSTPISKTVAPSVSADDFKSINSRRKPRSKKFDHHFSFECRAFNGSALKKSASVASSKKIISLGTGRPTADYYPWKMLAFESLTPALKESADQVSTDSPELQTVTKQDCDYNLALALNYGGAMGSPHLLRFFSEHTEMVHNPPYQDWDICLTAGATSAMEIAYRIFCNRGDNILMEDYTYPGTIEGASQLDLHICGVPIDAEGASADFLRKVLETWHLSRGAKPTIFYTIPYGHNPTGVTQSVTRRREIYQIAEEHDLIIIEDDPYYFLNMGSRAADISSNDTRIPTYLSIDTSGRVVRLDSTSKILAPGLRAGWVTASAQVIQKFIAYQEVSTVAVSGPSQLMLWKLLDETWGHEGFFTWLNNLSLEYRVRRDIMVGACELYLPKDICSWVDPVCGMFLWIELDWEKHPRFKHKDQLAQRASPAELVDIEQNILSASLANGVQVTKGSLFKCDKNALSKMHFRMTFAAAAKGDLEEGVKLFADAVKKEFALNL